MRTLLVTSRMSPELAARVQHSVSGRRHGARRPSTLTPLLRLTTAACVLALLGLVLYGQRQRAAQLSAERAALLAELHLADRSLGLAAAQRRRVEAALAAEASPQYQQDTFAPELRDAGRLALELARSTLYVRGPLAGMGSSAGVEQAAHGSYPDAFVSCLLDPPASRSEKALRGRARAAQTSSAGPALAQVQRLEPLLRVLPLLEPQWRERVVAADSTGELGRLRKVFATAPLAAASRAASATQLLAVMDEPGDARTPAELDGERAHAVRVILTELTTGQVKLRFRGAVDPSWLSQASRAEYASGIDSCSLALDLRRALLAEPTAAQTP